jgi:hypothetical protein
MLQMSEWDKEEFDKYLNTISNNSKNVDSNELADQTFLHAMDSNHQIRTFKKYILFLYTSVSFLDMNNVRVFRFIVKIYFMLFC